MCCEQAFTPTCSIRSDSVTYLGRIAMLIQTQRALSLSLSLSLCVCVCVSVCLSVLCTCFCLVLCVYLTLRWFSVSEWWGAGVVICLERDAGLHMVQLMPLPLTVSCFSKIQIGFTFLVPAHLVVPDKGLLNGCVCGEGWFSV